MWRQNNTLELHDLRQAIRTKTIKTCGYLDCTNPPADVHHIDGNHHNNTPENLSPACKPHHDLAHGISAQLSDLKLLVRLFYQVQEQRKAAGNRVRAYTVLGIPVPYAERAWHDSKLQEGQLGKYITAMVKTDPFYKSWLGKVKGVGPLLGASLLSEIGSVDKFPSARSLWAYIGLHVVEGKAPKQAKGIKGNWNPALRVTCWKLGGQFVKARRGLGRKLYDQYKAYYTERDNPTLSKLHIDNRARRKVVKAFVRCMWSAWRQQGGLSVTEPQEGTYPMPGDWV